MPGASAPITLLGETGVNVLTRWWRAVGGRDCLSLSRVAFWLPESRGWIRRPSLLSYFPRVFVGLQSELVSCEGGLAQVEAAKKLEVFA